MTFSHSYSITKKLYEGIIDGNVNIDENTNFINGIGGPKNTSITLDIDIKSEGTYSLIFNYLVINKLRPIKIDVNGENTGIVYVPPLNDEWNVSAAKNFTIPINLNKGNNTIKFYGNGIDYTPSLEKVRVISNDDNLEIFSKVEEDFKVFSASGNYSASTINGAQILSSGRVTGIGGYNDGTYAMVYLSDSEGSYTLELTLDTFKGTVLVVNVNEPTDDDNRDSDIINTYNIDSSTSPIIYKIQIYLNKGNNLITFNGDGVNSAPDILSVKFTLVAAIATKDIYYFSNGKLENGAKIRLGSTFVENLGGIDDGAVTVTVNVPTDGMYDLAIYYVENFSDSPINIQVNGSETLNYILPITAMEVDDIPEKFLISIMLKANSNSIKFHGNGLDKVCNLYFFTVSSTSVKSFSSSMETYDITGASFENGAGPSNSLAGFISGIGGVLNGSATINFTVSHPGEYNLSVKYLSIYDTKNLMIDINGSSKRPYFLQKTNSMLINDAKIFSIVVPLNNVNNYIKFYCHGPSYSATLGAVTISDVNATLTVPYKISSITLERGARKYSEGDFIVSIGGKKNGAAILNIEVSQAGFYDLALKYISPNMERSFRVKINKNSKNFKNDIYTLTKTKDWSAINAKTFTVPLNLNSGTNEVRIKGSGDLQAPILGEFKLTLSNKNSIFIYNLTDGILKNKASVNSYGLVENIGGPKGGEASIRVMAPSKGIYSLYLEYVSENESKFLIVYVNNIPTNDIYTAPYVPYWTVVDLPILNIKVSLETGYNDITFKSIGKNYAPMLGKFTLTSEGFPLGAKLEGTYYAGYGELGNNAGINNENGFVTYLGGKLDGSCTIGVTVLYTGEYMMTVEYLSDYDHSPLTFDINGEESGDFYVLKKTYDGEARNHDFEIVLNRGSNTIKFHGDKNDVAPDINSVKLQLLNEL